jgi:hypothetical protein
VTEQHHGRYFAQELMLDQSGNIREQIQDVLLMLVKANSGTWWESLTCCPSVV